MDDKYKGKIIFVPITVLDSEVEKIKDKNDFEGLVREYIYHARKRLVECIIEARPDLK